MKIIFITREGYNLPGARIRCYNLARELASYGIDTEVLSFTDTLGAKDGEEELQLKIKDKVFFNYGAFKRLTQEKEAIFYIQRFNYHSFAPYLVHLFKGNRVILDLDDWEMRENPRYYFNFFPSSKAHYLTQQIAKRSILCIAASRFLREFLSQYNRKVYYIPSGVNTALFRPSSNGLSDKEIVFSWIGTFHKEEYIDNIEFALDCFSILRKKYPYIYFDIVGSGIYRGTLMEIVKRFNDSNIRLKNWIYPDAIPAYLATIHIGMFPIVSDTKFNRAKSPTKLFEYMAMAKPTVSSRIGETTEIIQDGENGFLAETKEDFMEKMKHLIEDSDLRQRIGEKAHQAIERNYSLKVLGRQLYGILNQI